MASAITPELKTHLVELCGMAKDASDEDVRKTALDAISDGKLDFAKYTELTTPKATDAEKRIQKAAADAASAAVAPIADTLAKLLEKMTAGAGTDGASADGKVETKAGEAEAEKAAKPAETKVVNGGPDPAKAYSAGANAGTELSPEQETKVRLKSVVERYDDTRTAATWTKADGSGKHYLGDNQVKSATNGYHMDMPTRRSKAIAGAWFKHLVSKAFKAERAAVPPAFRMTEEDEHLVKYAVHESEFVGPVGATEDDSAQHEYFGTKLVSDLHRKSLLDDSTSGGLEAVPIEFDAAAIITPLLEGELFPYVPIVNVNRRRIEASAFGNPSIQEGVAEGSQISLFDTDSFISAFDNTIYPLTGSVEIGLDFMSDSPLNVADILIGNYGRAFRKKMDELIAAGAGTAGPLGIINTSGAGSVSSTNSTTGPPTPDDYEGLLFGVSKEYKTPGRSGLAVFIGTETSYKRCRAMKVDPAATSTDQRRLLGFDDLEGYSAFGHRYAINESTLLANTRVAFACLDYYRMYRRQGFEVRVETGGKELARKNQQLIIVRARYGGKMTLGGAVAVCTDMQT